MKTSTTVISAHDARTLFLAGQGLLTSDDRACSPAALYKEIERLGFVQLDSISVVERAHHHILATRFRTYSSEHLHTLHRRGKLFEHVTHDASLIPSRWFPHWHHRFARVHQSTWFKQQLGSNPKKILNMVRSRIESEGPLMARDFDDPTGQAGTWWQWKPAKAALEYLWRGGSLSVSERRQFQKVYDLTERVLPAVHALPAPTDDEHIDWACRTAIERLSVATAAEIAAFWRAVPLSSVRAWMAKRIEDGELIPVLRESLNGKKVAAVAVPNWRTRLRKVPEAPPHARLLSPFDPAVRDRRRCYDLFGFDYRFEAFVPAPQRKYGYYVLPILLGDKLIGRLDPKLDREAAVLNVHNVWLEPRIKRSKKLDSQLSDALDRYANFIGAREWRIKKRS